jgi:ribosomal protein S2
VFFANVSYSQLAVRECFASKVPSIGIIDTDTFYCFVSMLIPGNDEGVNAIAFYHEFFSNFILIKKFHNLIL